MRALSSAPDARMLVSCLSFGDVDYEVVFVDVLAYYLSGIYFVLGVDEEAAAVLQLVDGVGKCGACFE